MMMKNTNIRRLPLFFAVFLPLCFSAPHSVSGQTPGRVAIRPARLRAATVNSAELLAGERAPFGAIEKGKFADLIAVPGDPTTDITELEKVAFVTKGGAVVVKNERKSK